MASVLHALRALGEERCRREAVPLIRLHVIVEGQTEETFVNRVLGPELGAHGVFADAQRITTGRRHGHPHRGGHVEYEHLARDLMLRMKQDRHEESWFTTMIDLYRLPGDFPGRQSVPSHLPASARAERLEAALAEDIARRLGALPVSQRFIPYIQLHEFEALLFSEPSAFLEAFPQQEGLVDLLNAVRLQFDSPEEIDDDAPPSKRILDIAPQYEKVVAGTLVAQRIGLARIRHECVHFNAWVASLLDLAKA